MKKILIITLLLPITLLSQTTNLFFSEYGEGAGGSKKYLEIYNGTGADLNLANYQIWRNSNGSAWNVSPITLTGTILNNDVFVIANNATDVLGADVYNTNISHNGDDAYGLAWNGGSGTVFTLIDVFGTELVDPGTSWTIAGDANASVDKILIRKPNVCSPSTDWATIAGTDAASSQWFISVALYNNTNQTTDLGMHTSTCSSCNTTASLTLTFCTTYTVPSGDETHTTSGIYMDTIPNAAMCDSILTINLTITGGSITYYADLDGDGLGDLNNTTLDCTLPLGYVTNSNDCDDNDNLVGVATTVFYADLDLDTYGDPTNTIVACTQPVGYVSNNLDCNDTDNTIHPGAIEILDNGIDEDCDGSDASAAGTIVALYEFTDVAACPVTADTVTAQPTEATFTSFTTAGTTCSSTANVFNNSGWNTTATIDLAQYNEFSVATTGCNSIDINKIIFSHKNSASGGTPTWTLRSSLDNFTTDLGTGTSSTFLATDTIVLGAAFDAITTATFRFYVTNMGSTSATWRNDNVTVIANFGTLTPQTFYADVDGDTYGDATSTVSACQAPTGYVSDNTDCDDTNAAINPATVWFEDVDNDTHGNQAVTMTSCTQPIGYVLTSDDCDDNEATVYPGAPELCDGLDNDCANGIDDGLTFVDYFSDMDNDTYGAGTPMSACVSPGIGYVTMDGDCDDTNPNIYPGATEILDNGIDENCDQTDNYAGISTLVPFQFLISPNPSNGTITIEMSELLAGSIEVVDLNGKVLVTQSLNQLSSTMDLNTLSVGNYIVKITSENGIRQQRIVIQK